MTSLLLPSYLLLLVLQPPLTHQREKDPLLLSSSVTAHAYKKGLVMGRLLPFICWSHCGAYCKAIISVKNKFVGTNKAASCGASKHNMVTHRAERPDVATSGWLIGRLGGQNWMGLHSTLAALDMAIQIWDLSPSDTSHALLLTKIQDNLLHIM